MKSKSMRARSWLVAVVVTGWWLVAGAGCDSTSPASCKVVCAADSDCPDGQTCGELGRCTAGEACPCTAGEFLGCDGDSARACNLAGDGLSIQACTAGCNADAGRCNDCVPSSTWCDGTSLEHCGADGLVAETETCKLECVAEQGTIAAHCAYIEPAFLPDICDTPAVADELVVNTTVTYDTGADELCNGGIVMQTGAPAICVFRYRTIKLDGTLTIRGSRAAAFVGDSLVQVGGTVDVSADDATNGPGGGSVQSGAAPTTNLGGGGGGFLSVGANGGAATSGQGGAGGPSTDPFIVGSLFGGPRPTLPGIFQTNHPTPGGGGGALALIACRGTVSVSGTIDAGGGGGGGGRDTNISAAQSYVGGAGGGAGGYVAFQGVEVRVTSSGGSGVFANGGAGGGGCSADNCVGTRGQDALRSTAAAGGGSPMGEGGTGGNGGAGAPPSVGLASFFSPGGGGGASGWLQVFAPEGGTVVTSGTSSPGFATRRTLSLR